MILYSLLEIRDFCALNPPKVLQGRCEALVMLHGFAFSFFISLSESAMRLNGLNISDKTFVHQNRLLPHHLLIVNTRHTEQITWLLNLHQGIHHSPDLLLLRE
jgi:hypothetical protein